MMADIFGYLATSLNLVMLVPQVIRTWSTKQTKDLSLASLGMFLVANILWVSYGVSKGAIPVVLANVVIGVMNLILIVMKFKYPNK